jgi:pimeloyl-ACP methyl ester carboxylesterase
METILQLEIAGYQGLPLTNTFFKQSLPAKRLALLFPGRGYSCAMPVLYYPARWLSAHGADVLTIEYGFTHKQNSLAKLNNEDLLRWLAADAAAALSASMSSGQYEEIVLVGKSLGTLALSQLSLHLPSSPAQFSFVWLTPLFKNPVLRDALLQTRPRSFFVQGEADPLYDADFFAEMRAACSAQALLIPGADHSLELAGDFEAALSAISQLLVGLSTFTAW